jgi:hypothetical protein
MYVLIETQKVQYGSTSMDGAEKFMLPFILVLQYYRCGNNKMIYYTALDS